jgi:hypothetical protein
MVLVADKPRGNICGQAPLVRVSHNNRICAIDYVRGGQDLPATDQQS